MTVPAARTISNQQDTSRKWPTTALAERVLTAAEGVVVEELTGPGIGLSVELSQPIVPGTPVFVLAHDGAGAFEAGGAAPAAVPVPVTDGTHLTVLAKNGNGVGQLTESGGRDYSGSVLRVQYSPDQPEGTIGGQSSAT